jgi:hypothetical protein
MYGGAAVVALWTFIRHITNGVNFDVVGQIGLADQWAHGLSSGVVLGQTNYLLKMPLYALANMLHFISPMNRLLLLALVFNIATFVILFLLVEKMLKLHGVKDKSWLYLGMAWLATIAGSVYWLEYANSRNLETVGGIFLIYLVMRYMKSNRTATAAAIALVAAAVFFADSLQLFVGGGGVVLYVIGRWLWRWNYRNFLQMAVLTGAVLAGYLGSKILSLLSQSLLPVSYLAVPSSQHSLSLANITQSLQSVTENTLKIFGADFLSQPYGPNSVRQLLNFIVVAGIAGFAVWLLVNKKRYPGGLLPVLILANFIIYIASGQALEPNTSRYLIMIPLVTVIFIALYAPRLPARRKQRLQQAWLGIIIVSSILLLGALINSWPDRHAKDQHIYQTLSYMRQNNFKYALGSHELGVTATYLGGGPEVILPVSCKADHKVHVINLFYDKGAFKLLRGYSKEVPVILAINSQQPGVNQCDKASIIAAFGQPKREQTVAGIGVVEMYDAPSIKIAD